MTQTDYVALGIKLFGPQCLELSRAPEEILFDDGAISLNAITGQVTIGDTDPVEMRDLVSELTKRKKQNGGGSGHTIIAQLIAERKACSRSEEEPTTLEPDSNQLEIFVEALFRHCSKDGVVSLRSFHQEDSDKSAGIKPISLKDGLKALIKAAMKEARRAANAAAAVAFTPPVATFKVEAGWQAREEDLFEGPVLSVELDENPRAALAKREGLLGVATLVVRCGGEWTNPKTGEVEPKTGSCLPAGKAED